MEKLVKKIARYTVFSSVLLAMSFSAIGQMTYSPDHVTRFNMTNQCKNCDLSGASLSGNHSGALLIASNLTGSTGRGTFSMSSFTDSNLSGADWSGANLSYGQLNGTVLTQTNFMGANLSFANFEKSNTNGAVFDYAILFGAKITQQQLDSAASYCNATLPDGSKKKC